MLKAIQRFYITTKDFFVGLLAISMLVLAPVSIMWVLAIDSGNIRDFIDLVLVYGAALLIEVIVLLWRKRPQPLLNRLLLTGSVTFASICSFVLAYIANRNANSIWCHSGPPPISSYNAYTIEKSIEETCHVYAIFLLLIICIYIIDPALIVIGINALFTQRTNDTQ